MRGRHLIALTVLVGALVVSPGSVLAGANTSDPSAAEFGQLFVHLANGFGSTTRVAKPHCVEAAPRHYLCAYVTVQPGLAARCHLMQAEWTPNAASTITVRLSGRVAVCDTLRHALRSLR
jgi:hypothetical protein